MERCLKKQKIGFGPNGWLLPCDLVRNILKLLPTPYEYYRVARQLCRKSRNEWMVQDVRWRHVNLVKSTPPCDKEYVISRLVECSWDTFDALQISVGFPISLKDYMTLNTVCFIRLDEQISSCNIYTIWKHKLTNKEEYFSTLKVYCDSYVLDDWNMVKVIFS